ncbi:MAG: hypothetical protein ABFD85_13845 [Phycisphaerae bacterium]
MLTVYPIGTTLYKPDRCCNGYTILWGEFDIRERWKAERPRSC